MNNIFSFHIIILFCTACFIFVSAEKKDTATSPANFSIAINTADSSITVKGSKFKPQEFNKIKERLGKPDRIKQHQHISRYEEFGTGGQPPTSRQIKVTDYYYIYDKLGIMLYTSNGFSNSKVPDKMSIHFSNKRTFTNTAPLPFSPASAFAGTLTINTIPLLPSAKLIPDSIHYRSENFSLFNTFVGITSIGAAIDRLYSVGTQPYLLFYLDNEKSRKLSYIEIE